MRKTGLVLLAVVAAAVAATPQAVAQQADQQSDVVGTYQGRLLGTQAGEVVTLSLMPGGKAAVAIAPSPGATPLVSRGTWRLIASDYVRVSVGGAAGFGTIYFRRFDSQLVETQQTFRLSTRFPLHLYQQAPIPGTYIAIRTRQNQLQTLTLQLDPDGAASLTVEQRMPEAPPVNWIGEWQWLPTGEVSVSLSSAGVSQKMTLSRSDGTLSASGWNREIWGNAPITFTRQ